MTGKVRLGRPFLGGKSEGRMRRRLGKETSLRSSTSKSNWFVAPLALLIRSFTPTLFFRPFLFSYNVPVNLAERAPLNVYSDSLPTRRSTLFTPYIPLPQ